MQDLPFNLGDAVVIVIVLLSAILAFARGFVRELLSIAGWVGAAIATYFLLPEVRPYIRREVETGWLSGMDFLNDNLILDVLAGAIIFLVALIVFATVGALIARMVRGSAVNAVDRSLGFLFGVVRGAILVSLGYLLVDWLYDGPLPSWVANARTLPMVQRGAEVLQSLVPEDVMDRVPQILPRSEPVLPMTPPEPVQPATPPPGQPTPDANRIDQAAPPPAAPNP